MAEGPGRRADPATTRPLRRARLLSRVAWSYHLDATLHKPDHPQRGPIVLQDAAVRRSVSMMRALLGQFWHFERQYGAFKMLAAHPLWEDLFWKRKQGNIDWLEKLMRRWCWHVILPGGG